MPVEPRVVKLPIELPSELLSDPEVVAPAERAAETGCSKTSSASLVSSIEVGPGIEFSVGDAAYGVLPLVAERAPSLELPVWACGVSKWTPSLGGLTMQYALYWSALRWQPSTEHGDGGSPSQTRAATNAPRTPLG